MTTYTVNVQGYGAEMVFARITKEQYEYWKPLNDEESDAINQHLFWDPYEEDEGNEITDDTDPRWLGMWYDMEGTIEQCHGAEAGSAWLRIYDENNEMVHEMDIGADKVEPAEDTSAKTEGEGYYCKAQSSEKGTFISAQLEVDGEIDLSKFKFYGCRIDGDLLVTNLEYDGEDLEDDGGDTNGKGYYVDFSKNPE